MAKINLKNIEIMRKYWELKAKYPDTIMLLREDNFYKSFGEDATTTSKLLGIPLKKHNCKSLIDAQYIVFSYYALDTYLSQLVKAGQRVAICDEIRA